MENLGDSCRQFLQAQFDASTYNAFVRPTALALENGTLYLSCPNRATERWLRKHAAAALQAFLAENNPAVALGFRLAPAAAGQPQPDESQPPPFAPRPANRSNLHSKHSFGNFIPGRANEIPLIAAKDIAKGSSAINPLFIYGSTGLGKTHLIQAIGNEYLCNFPQRRVLYIGARSFLNEVVSAYRLNRQEQFKSRYQDLDLLIIDDIQYIGGDKVRTQEEFFFLFNSLYERDKSVVISCDRAPSQISDLPQRLTTRFSAGLPIHITPPEFELRADIIRQKAAQRGVRLGGEVVLFIAEHVKSNVRELEGAINRVHAMAQFEKTAPSIDICRRAMADLIGQANVSIHPDAIKEKVAGYYHIRASDLSSQKRHGPIVHARHVAIYLCRQMTNLSLPSIGQHFGKRNHTTVLHSCRKMETQLKNDPSLWEEVKHIENSIKG